VTFPQIGAYPRLGQGAVPPVRSIAGQQTLLSRGAHYLHYDEVHDEIMMANPFAQAILFFRGGADGDEPPIRVIQGPKTQLVSPDFGLALDPVNDEIYIAEQDSVLVFSRTANGDVAPIRKLAGPNTQLDNPWGNQGLRGIGVDPIHNVLVVNGYFANRGHILIFDRTASGNAKPRGVIAGPKSGIGGASYSMRVYPPKGWILNPIGGGLGVWSVNDSGDIPPVYILGRQREAAPASAGGAAGQGSGTAGQGGGGAAGQGGGGGGTGLGDRFAINPNAKEIVAESNNALNSYSFPEIF
jgi:hypothetical protein